MSKKIDRATHGPSWAEVFLGAALSVVLGVVLGALLLTLRPVVVVKEMPKEADRDPKAVYYVEGSRDSSKARQALAKRKAFAEGQSVTVSEDEVNALLSPTPGAPAAPKPGEKAKADPKAKEAEKAAPAAASGELLATGAASVRIRAGAIQVGVPVTLDVLGVSQKVVVQAHGGIAKQGDVFNFVPETLYVGSCPVQRLPFVSGYVRNKVLASQPIPEDIKASWLKLANVAVEGNVVKLTMP